MDSGQQTLVKKRKKGGRCVVVCVCLDQSSEHRLRSYKDQCVHIVQYRAGSENARKKRRESSVQSRSTSFFLLTQRKYYAATRAH